MVRQWRPLLIIAASGLAGLLALLPLTVAVAVAAAERPNYAADDFLVRWQRIERPVTLGLADRGWLWGPGPNSIGLYETYAESPGGERLVQYFDKSRMEITRPATAPTDLWRVTNGRLPVELMSGSIQTGDQQWYDTGRPARIPVVGDPTAAFPTYADLGAYQVQPGRGVDRRGQHVSQVLTPAGPRAGAPYTSSPETEYVSHVVWSGGAASSPRAFQQFMQQGGVIWRGEGGTGGYGWAAPVLDPLYAYGYPVTEPYWVRVPVGAVERWVMLQCFERRCLSFTPDNPSAFLVEAGNVGRHYWQWRYGTPPEAGERASHWSGITVGSRWQYRSAGTGLLDETVIDRQAAPFGPTGTPTLRQRSLTPNGQVVETFLELTESGLVEHGTRAGAEQCVNQPPLLVVPREQTIGTSWESTVTTRCTSRPTETHRLRGWVDGQEVLSVEAGRLTTLRLHSTRDGEPWVTTWFAPGIGIVKVGYGEFYRTLAHYRLH